MFSQWGVGIDIHPRKPEFALIGAGGAALATWVDVPAEAAISVAFLVAFRVRLYLLRP